jgi:hypothetical protein
MITINTVVYLDTVSIVSSDIFSGKKGCKKSRDNAKDACSVVADAVDMEAATTADKTTPIPRGGRIALNKEGITTSCSTPDPRITRAVGPVK